MARSREAHRAYMREYYHRPEVHSRSLRQAEKRRRDPRSWAKHRITQLRCKVRKTGMELSITEADLTLPAACPVLGIPLTIGEGGKTNPHSASVDRIDNSKGYIPGNVKVVSLRANQLKRDATIEELEAVLAYMKAHQCQPSLSAA